MYHTFNHLIIRSALALLILLIAIITSSCGSDEYHLKGSQWIVFRYEKNGKSYTVREYAKKQGIKNAENLRIELDFSDSGSIFQGNIKDEDDDSAFVSYPGTTRIDKKDIFLTLKAKDSFNDSGDYPDYREMNDGEIHFTYDEKTDTVLCMNHGVKEIYLRENGVRGYIFEAKDSNSQAASEKDPSAFIGQYSFDIDGKVTCAINDRGGILEDNEYSLNGDTVRIIYTAKNTEKLRAAGLKTDKDKYEETLAITYKKNGVQLENSDDTPKRKYSIIGMTDHLG